MDKENRAPKSPCNDAVSAKGKAFPAITAKSQQRKISLKPSSLQLYIRLDNSEEYSSLRSSKPLDSLPSSSDIWDFSDTDAAPASSWSTLPNKSLLLRPLPLDVGLCTCIITKELINGISCYALYTNEGHGRQDRKLAVARHIRKRNGRSEFIIAQNSKGIICSSEDSFLGTITSNLMGSRYQIWEHQETKLDFMKSQSSLMGAVEYVPTITTIAGSFRSIRVCIPKQKSVQPSTINTTKIQNSSGLPKNWEEKKNMTERLFSRVPQYNNITKRYELDFRGRAGRTGLQILASTKNFQLIMEDGRQQTILQLGRIEKSKYLIDFRHPLTGYQALCICLSSIDSKLCCTV